MEITGAACLSRKQLSAAKDPKRGQGCALGLRLFDGNCPHLLPEATVAEERRIDHKATSEELSRA